MKFVLVPILMMLLLTQTFSKWMWVLEYELNKEYIANNLCVNKEKVELKCKGKCQLAKKLVEEEQQEKNSATGNSLKLQFQEVLFENNLSDLDLALWQALPGAKQSRYELINYSAPLLSFFHPPAVA